MKNKLVAILIILVVVIIAWISSLSSPNDNDDRKQLLIGEINANIDVKTYKNTIPLYEELISIDPANIQWYIDLADAYANINQYAKYLEQIERTVETFPDSVTAYMRWIKYYADSYSHKDVIAIYQKAPENVKSNEEILELYSNSEWAYRFLSDTFSSIGSCINNVYVVKFNGLYGYYGENSGLAIEPQFVQARPFMGDYAPVYKGDEWYFIDREGDRVLATKEKIEDLYSFNNGFAVAKYQGKYGYIDMSFNFYHFEFDDATCFANGVAAVKKGNKWGVINLNFEEVLPFVFDDIIRDDTNLFSRSGVMFLKQDGKYSLYSVSGTLLSEEKFDDARVFYSDYTAVKQDEKWGYVDTNGSPIIDFVYDDASPCASGLACVRKGEYWGCIDLKGNTILEFDYESLNITSTNGVVVVKLGEMYRFIKFIKY